MVSTTSQINKFIEFIAVLGDLIILNLVLSFLLFFWEEAFVSLPFSCRVSWMMTSLSLCYLACSGSRGRVWDSRGIRPDQLVLRVLKNIIAFSIFWACIMTFSGISIYSPLFFVAYFSFLFVILSIYRIIIRHFLMVYCAKGKHRRYAVFIGGGNNMQVLYEEMESSLILNRTKPFLRNVPIWVILTVSQILCPHTRVSSMFFVLCRWRKGVIIFLS